MRENRLRTIWKAGGAVVNGWLAIANSFSAETMAHQGWDSLTIDLQHGVVDYQAMIPMLQAISTTDTVPVVRVPWLEPSVLMKALDAGAYAVICPMVNTREDAQKLVAYTHYAPRRRLARSNAGCLHASMFLLQVTGALDSRRPMFKGFCITIRAARQRACATLAQRVSSPC